MHRPVLLDLDVAQGLGDRIAREGGFAGRQFVEHESRREDIGARIHL